MPSSSAIIALPSTTPKANQDKNCLGRAFAYLRVHLAISDAMSVTATSAPQRLTCVPIPDINVSPRKPAPLNPKTSPDKNGTRTEFVTSRLSSSSLIRAPDPLSNAPTPGQRRRQQSRRAENAIRRAAPAPALQLTSPGPDHSVHSRSHITDQHAPSRSPAIPKPIIIPNRNHRLGLIGRRPQSTTEATIAKTASMKNAIIPTKLRGAGGTGPYKFGKVIAPNHPTTKIASNAPRTAALTFSLCLSF